MFACIRHIFDVIETAVTKDGYRFVDEKARSIVIWDEKDGAYYEIIVKELE